MKKIFLSLFILFLTFGVSAETGYNGNRWYKSRNDITFHEDADPYFSDAYLDIDARAERINDTIVYYHFVCGMFMSVSYTISEKQVLDFKNEMQSLKVEERKAESFSPFEMIAYINSLGKNSSGLFYDFYSNKYFANACVNVTGPIGLYNDYGRGTITKYNYNDDTWIYLLENLVMGSNYVIYVVK